jgi:hypothetical protein
VIGRWRGLAMVASLSCAAAFTACDDDEGTAVDAGSPVDVARPDGAIEAGVGTQVDADGAVAEVGVASEAGVEAGAETAPPGSCAAPLVGATAFGKVLSGTGDLETDIPNSPTPVRPKTITVHAYFPAGRRPGQPVILAMPTRWPRPGLAWSMPQILDATAGIPAIPGIDIADDLGTGFSGALLGPDQGLQGTGSANFAFGTDVGDSGRGPITLCPAGDVPAATLTSNDPAFVPNLPLWFAPGAPLDEKNLPAVSVSSGGKNVPVTATVTLRQPFFAGTALVVTPVVAFPPNQPLTIELGGLADPLGRPFVIAAPPPLQTTATVTDLTFDTAPPVGAVVEQGPAGHGSNVAGGLLILGDRNAFGVSALVALGDPGARTKVRLHGQWDCGAFRQAPTEQSRSLLIVGAQGEATQVALTCGPPQDVVVDRPAAGPLWLSFAGPPNQSHPQFLPPGPSSVAAQIDAITFE